MIPQNHRRSKPRQTRYPELSTRQVGRRASFLSGLHPATRQKETVAQPGERGKALLAITNAIVGMHREFYGRGATRGRTIMQENYVMCVLDDIYNKAERTLIDAGRFAEVKQARLAFQDTMEERFSKAVEEATGRRVVGFLSQVRTDPDVSTEIFILEPDGAPPAK
jgi:uncharacterized protein YbcI